MNKKFSPLLLIIVIFLSVQTFSLLHVSKFGLKKHEHNGQTCNIYLIADHNKLLSNKEPKLVSPNLLTLRINPPQESLLFFTKIQLFKARAPPLFS